MTLNTSSVLKLSSYDYVIFVGTLVFSTLIGIYYGCFGTKQATIKEYLLGGKNMKILPIAVSVAVSHISGTLLIGTVADVYRYGGSVWLYVGSFVAMGVLATFVYLPVFYKLQVANMYEYLEKRFDKKIKMFALILYLLCEIFIFPILAYTPSLTFATASGFNPSLCAFFLCVVCVFYTSIGGLKTVVWTDFLQFGIIAVSLITLYIIGLNTTGGFLSVWNTAAEGQRLEIFNFQLDLTARDGFWGYIIGGAPTTTALIIIHQTGLQKFLSLSNYKDGAWSVLHTVISMSLVHTFCVFIGLVAYSKYKDCDPLTSHLISKHDQLFPLFVTEIGGHLPGIPGLFIAAICSAALSSMSSNLNALSGVMYNDVVCEFLKKKPSDKKATNILKLIVLIVGLLCSCLVFVIQGMGEVFSVSLTIWGITQGPILGAFTLGVLFPKANQQGALYGMILGCISVACIAIPAKYYQTKGLLSYPTKPLSTNGCSFFNASNFVSTNKTISQFQPSVIFKTSFYFYAVIGVTVTVIVGLVVSFFTKSGSSVHKNFLSPVIHSCLKESVENQEYADAETTLELLQKQ
ncbi:sodium-coupled monocarboxylate transporter 2-like isoform X2 [Zophobas morio]|uniref:sodium-coupled monocarboxylate transporter 2-like isoform X2 n=1 Tax=Zophobas morio TaxID=2755281 RepID=UPI00308333AA